MILFDPWSSPLVDSHSLHPLVKGVAHTARAAGWEFAERFGPTLQIIDSGAHAIYKSPVARDSVGVAFVALAIARIWSRRRDAPLGHLEAQNEELRAELGVIRDELRETQERLDFAERVLAQQRRGEPLPPPGEQGAGEQPSGER